MQTKNNKTDNTNNKAVANQKKNNSSNNDIENVVNNEKSTENSSLGSVLSHSVNITPNQNSKPPAGIQLVQLKTDEKEKTNFLSDFYSLSNDSGPIQQKVNNDNITSQLGNSFNTDFSNVNIHQNSETASNLGALAFTQGNNVHFAPGKFNPESKQGKQLIGHEFAHVVQQRQGKVQTTKQIGKFNVNDNSGLEKEADYAGEKFANSQKNNFILTSLQTNNSFSPVQMTPTKGIIISNAHFHKKKTDGTPDLGGKFSSGTIGDKFVPGDEVENIHFDLPQVDGFYEAIYKGDAVFIRAASVINASLLGEKREDVSKSSGDIGESDAGKLGSSIDMLSNVSDKNGLYSDVVTEDNSEKVNGLLKSKDDDKINKSLDKDAAKIGVVAGISGATAGILGMISSAKSFKNETGWKKFEAGASFVAETAKTVSSGSALVDSMAKVLGNEKGISSADVVSKYSGAVAGAISSVTSAVKGLSGLFSLYNSKSTTKGKDALVSFKLLASAALDAAGVAKTAFQIIGNGIPLSLISAIPAISIAVSAIDLIIRFADAIKAGGLKSDMIEESDDLRTKIKTDFGVTAEELVFDTTRRGTFPAYKTYYRVKKDIVGAIDSSIVSVFDAENNFASTKSRVTGNSVDIYKQTGINSRIEASDNEIVATNQKIFLKNQNIAAINLKIDKLKKAKPLDQKAIKEEERKKILIELEIDDYKDELAGHKTKKSAAKTDETNLNTAVKRAVSTNVDTFDLTPLIKSKIKSIVNSPSDVIKLQTLSQKIRNYEFVDKMSEINQKRQVSGWTDVGYDLINITADILSLTGVASIVGVSLKAAVGGAKLAHGGAKFIQKLYRDRGDGSDEKSTSTKHAEYVRHTKYIFSLMASIDTKPSDWEKGGVEEVRIMKYLKATGVNTGLLFAMNGSPEKQAEMIVEAMKIRN